MAKEEDRRQDTISCRAATRANHYNGGTLFSLSRELRDEIYDYLLASGHLQILRTSRPLSQEALESLYRKAIFRLYVNSAHQSRNIWPSGNVAGQIQNIEVQWEMSDFNCSRNAHEVIDFCQNSQAARGTCHIILKFNTWRATLLNATDIFALRNLRVFQKVCFKSMMKDSTKLRGRILKIFKMLSNELGLALGPADNREDVDAQYLVFHPSSISENRFDKLSVSKTAYSW